MEKAFAPCSLGGMELRNRIVRSATFDPLGSPDGEVTEEQIGQSRALAGNQVGLIISAMTNVSPEGIGAALQNAIYDDRFLPGHRRLTAAVHGAGGKVVLQINHAGASGIRPAPPSPSGVTSRNSKAPSREMTRAEMQAVAADFAAAAARTRAAGYDGVQIHCAHGYLLSEFLSPYDNRRTDEYGGSAENRFRFPGEVIAAVRKAVGPDYPVLIKLNSNAERDDEAYGQDLLLYGKRLAELGVTAIEVSGYDFTPQGKSGKSNYYLERAAALRRACGIPVILVGGMRSKADLETVLDAGIDLVSLSRPFISEPDLVKKMMEGQERSNCISCSKCFVLMAKYKPGGRRCILWPEA